MDGEYLWCFCASLQRWDLEWHGMDGLGGVFHLLILPLFIVVEVRVEVEMEVGDDGLVYPVSGWMDGYMVYGSGEL